MLDEGLAREVVNRVQKLRKKAKLQPSDVVTVQYIVEPANHELTRIIAEHRDYIETSTKNDMTPNEASGEVMIVEDYDLKGAKMTLKIWKETTSSSSVDVASAISVTLKNHGVPQVPYINVVSGSKTGVVLLENPIGLNKLTSWNQVSEEIAGLFGSPSKTSDNSLFSDSRCSVKVTGSVPDFNGKTIFLTSCKVNSESAKLVGGACCPFANVNFSDKKGCLLLQNPFEQSLTEYSSDVLNATFGKSVGKLNGTPVDKVNWEKAAGQNFSAS